jgi:hypothetical protein
MLPDLTTPTAALAAACAGAAREVDSRDPRTLDRLVLVVEALDVALRPGPGPTTGEPGLRSLRDAIGDCLVVLSAAGMPESERDAVCTSLSAALAEAAELLASAGSGPAPICWNSPRREPSGA